MRDKIKYSGAPLRSKYQPEQEHAGKGGHVAAGIVKTGMRAGNTTGSKMNTTCSHTCCVDAAVLDGRLLLSERGVTANILHCTLLACCSRVFCVELKGWAEPQEGKCIRA
jgi:hypothetical protein